MNGAGPMHDAPRLAFVCVKGFSGGREGLMPALAKHCRISAEIDAYAAIDPRRGRPAALANLGSTLWHYGIKGRQGSRLLKTPLAFRAMTRYVARRLAATAFDVVLQTQCLCGDGRRAGNARYVIYTDCTFPMAARIYPDWDAPRAMANMEREALQRADVIALHNATAQASMVEDYGIEPARTALIGCGLRLPKDAPPRTHWPPALACLTTDPARHRVDVLCEVFARVVAPKHPDATLTLAGAHLDQLPAAGARESRLGSMNHADATALLAGAGIYVMPSRAGGYSSVLDAMAAGCACVVASNPFLGPVVRDGETALVMPHGGEDELAERLTWLLDHPEERERLGRAAMARVREECGWDNVTARLMRAIQERG